LAAATSCYHELVFDSLAQAPAWPTEFLEAQSKRLLSYGGRPLCPALRPNLIDEPRNRHLREVCAVLRSCVLKVKEAVQRWPLLAQQLGLSSGERMLAEIEPGYHRYAVSYRFDGFFGPDGRIRFVELNAESPAGIAYADQLARLFLETPPMERFQRNYQVIPPRATELLLAGLLEAYHDWGGSGEPNIAIVDWAELPTATEFELLREAFGARGLASVIADPRDLEFDGRRLRHRGWPIDLVYRRVATNELLERLAECRALVEAYRAQRVCVVNSFRVKYVHKKALFALLTDETNARLFDAAERVVLARHLPWTRRVARIWTTHHGRRIDLLDFILRQRRRLVLKPNDEYGGRGVVLGHQVGDLEWERCLGTALDGDWVVQELVEAERQQFPLWDDGVQLQDCLVDLDPILIGAEVGGYLGRLSRGGLTNVSSGSGLTPTFQVRLGRR
jgi:hypothetical protein